MQITKSRKRKQAYRWDQSVVGNISTDKKLGCTTVANVPTLAVKDIDDW